MVDLASKAKAQAKPKAKSKQLGRLPKPPGVNVGCSRCRYSEHGCASCRLRAGLTLNEEQTAWILRPVLRDF